MLVLNDPPHRLFDAVTDEEPSEEQLKAINRCVAKVTEGTEQMKFNTSIAVGWVLKRSTRPSLNFLLKSV